MCIQSRLFRGIAFAFLKLVSIGGDGFGGIGISGIALIFEFHCLLNRCWSEKGLGPNRYSSCVTAMGVHDITTASVLQCFGMSQDISYCVSWIETLGCILLP